MQLFHYLPICQLVLVIISFSTTYLVAVLSHHVEPLFPYISYTGCRIPEASIFAELTDFIILSMLGNVYLRFLQIQELNLYSEETRVPQCLNVTSTVAGFLSVLGLSIVPNFRLCGSETIHFIGYWICCVFGTVYLSLQTYVSKKHSPNVTHPALFNCRIIIFVVTSVAVCITFFCGAFAENAFNGQNILMWKPEDGGYELHLASTFTQWIMVFSANIYFATFFWDFKQFDYRAPLLETE